MVDAITTTKKVGGTGVGGRSLYVNVTDMAKILGFEKGDLVKVTVSVIEAVREEPTNENGPISEPSEEPLE
ncbi:MAG: hypothetical protein Q3982_08150 [Phoenicibacter congonensis]|uniref:Uncharacterized protein n=1 Tax=Phoenicibacter congonensis TaxID=1944646 RepID=A0AA43RIV8_9ACTN|nr:hypothetical protein [Phoenicibacter congonensis]